MTLGQQKLRQQRPNRLPNSLAEIGLYTRHPVMCAPSNASNRSRKHQSWTPEEWGVFFSMMSRDSPEFFSLSVIWRKSGICFYLCYVTEIDRFEGRGTLVWGGVMGDSRTPLHSSMRVQSTDSFIGKRLLKPM
ncbi:hypothetical protein TNCV_850351 [Trichonephila clavipes]|uniref:Uncharacterized protein n=1 Tax=Trichonephila clavipes TaxID=2585209 RepID=A0A8X6RTE1_TRICX|nr:hypothetical protein TNCV_850351 [Trichonephila clavipes]